MNDQIPLYGLIRGGASVAVARIEQLSIHGAAPGQEAVVLDVRIDEVLFGSTRPPLRHYELMRPTSEIARLKFPDPVWGRVTIQQGARIVLAVPAGPPASDPAYVESVVDDDPVLAAVRAVLDAERTNRGTPERFARYMHWLAGGTPVERLFGAEALAKDPLPEVDPGGDAARTFSAAFLADSDLYRRLTIGAWMWEHILAKTSAAGRAAVINATVESLAASSDDIRRFAFDRLVGLDAALWKQPGLVPHPQAITALQALLSSQGDPHTQAEIRRLIALLHGAAHDQPRHK